jgi:hypothetical protein
VLIIVKPPPLGAVAGHGNSHPRHNPYDVYIAPKSGNIRYIVVNQRLKWQHNWQHGGNIRYIVVLQAFKWQQTAQ